MDVQGDDEMNVQNDGDYENPQVQDPATDTPQSISPAPVQADQPSQVLYLRVLTSTYACRTYTCIYEMTLLLQTLSLSLSLTHTHTHILTVSFSLSHLPSHYSNIHTERLVGKLQ